MKYFYLKVLSLFFAVSSAQIPTVEWQNSIGGSNWQVSYSSLQAEDGGFVIGGRSNSNISGDKTENSKGNHDYWLVKTDPNGNILWDKTIGAASPSEFSQDIFMDMQQTQDAGIIVCGYSNSPASGDKTQDAYNESDDFWIVKTNSQGVMQWDRTVGGSGIDQPYAILAENNNCLVGGYSASPISGDKTESSRGLNDYWVLKLDDAGNIIWQRTLGGSGHDGVNAISRTMDNGYLIGGNSNSGISGEKTEANRGSLDYWIIKLDNDGNIVWQKTFGGSGTDSLWSINNLEDGGFLLSGYSDSPISGDKTAINKGGSDYWLIRIDMNGEILWQQTYGGSGSDTLLCSSKCADNGFILTGTSDSIASGDKTEGVMGVRDSWTIRINSQGNILWEKTLGGNMEDGFNSVLKCNDGGFFLSGGTRSEISGDITENPNGIIDFWILKTETENLSLSVNESPVPIIFPNPTDQTIHVNLGENSGSSYIEIRNVLGQKVQSGYYFNKLIAIDIGGANGIYFMTVHNGTKYDLFKIIKR